MGKAASAQSKEGYEKVPVADAAQEAAQFLTSGKETVKSDKPTAPVETRTWDGHLFCCFGRCDSVGWGACLVSYFVPCVAFGLNMRRGLLLSALKQALVFAILVALSWSLNAVRVATILAECPPPGHFYMQYRHGVEHPFGRPFGPGFGQPAGVAQAMQSRDFMAVPQFRDDGMGMAPAVAEPVPMTALEAPLPATSAAAAATAVVADGMALFEYKGPRRSWEDMHAMRKLATKVIAQHEVLPEDKAAARALGLCVKTKDHGAFVRFKGHKLREHKLGKHDQGHKTAVAKKSVKHAAVHLDDHEALPWWSAALGKGAHKHHGHGQIKHREEHKAEEDAVPAHKFRNLLDDDEDDDEDDDRDEDDDKAGEVAPVAVPAMYVQEVSAPVLDGRAGSEHPAQFAGYVGGIDVKFMEREILREQMQREFAGRLTPEHVEECRRLHGIGAQIALALMLYLIGLTVYAAHRRTELRQRFNIAGSKIGDFCAWCWCPAMALCQETRTLAANNVEAGVWHGRAPAVAAAEFITATTPPKVRVMSALAAPTAGGEAAAAVDTVRMV